ncbi:hypothetical protein C8Q75DRAFT_340916 [Abortiporus biennis]|nr:hypothetical protein C8Q75DRAFT_340916 [Abortiporus biennis]
MSIRAVVEIFPKQDDPLAREIITGPTELSSCRDAESIEYDLLARNLYEVLQSRIPKAAQSLPDYYINYPIDRPSCRTPQSSYDWPCASARSSPALSGSSTPAPVRAPVTPSASLPSLGYISPYTSRGNHSVDEGAAAPIDSPGGGIPFPSKRNARPCRSQSSLIRSQMFDDIKKPVVPDTISPLASVGQVLNLKPLSRFNPLMRPRAESTSSIVSSPSTMYSGNRTRRQSTMSSLNVKDWRSTFQQFRDVYLL